MPDSPLILILAGAIRDAAGTNARPGAVALRGNVIVAAGDPTEVRRQLPQPPERTIELPDTLILPAMVNAHAHLDLTDLGQRPYAGDFIPWVRMVMRDRPRGDAAITAAVRRGLQLSRQAGVGWLGDIAGSPAAARARFRAAADIAIAGVSYLECFGLGAAESAAVEEATRWWGALTGECEGSPQAATVRVELQPHAPYSAGAGLYRLAAELSATPTTHLAETKAEAQFVRDATGPFADLLRQMGKLDAAVQPRGCSPVRWLVEQLGGRGWLLAHCNHVDDADISLLASSGCSVAYCPVASDYFGHRNHRYRDMLAAGVNVCLGTDSIICQRPDEPQPLGILAQMRHLHRRDGTAPATLLSMATVAGARLFNGTATLGAGGATPLIGIRFDPADAADPLTQVLGNRQPAQPVVLHNP